MGDVMLFGILRMPYDMAMENEISRHQYWQSGQQAADEIERLKGANRAFAEQVTNDYKEIKRLREALQKIAKPTYGSQWFDSDEERAERLFRWFFHSQKIARAALQQKESE